LWTRAKSKVAESTAGVLRADFREDLTSQLSEDPSVAWASFQTLFSDVAREHNMIVVAGSGYVLDDEIGGLVNQAVVFSADGGILGRQVKVSLNRDDQPLALAGRGWAPIDTPVGRIGILMGNDALYPEAGRILAYEGATMLLGLGACPGSRTHHKVRAGLMARVQENELYGMASFLVGRNQIGMGERRDFAGQSAILAPSDFTPGGSGVMVQLGTTSSEGVITAEWDFAALRELWTAGETRVRQAMPMASFRPLGDRYLEERTLQSVWDTPPYEPPALPVPDLPESEVLPVLPEAREVAEEPEPELDSPLPDVVPVDMLPEIAVAEPEPPPADFAEADEGWLPDAGEPDVAEAIVEELLADESIPEADDEESELL
jgi:predicted amidohydrolase